MPPDSLPAHLPVERDAIIAEIYAAWKGTTRGDGMDWVDAVLEDGLMEDVAINALRAVDDGHDWTRLIAADAWETSADCSAMRFIDAGGFRYYLAPAMVRCLNLRRDVGVIGALEYPQSFSSLATERWSLLDARQQACIARFMRCMSEMDSADAQDWSRAWYIHWREFDDPSRG